MTLDHYLMLSAALFCLGLMMFISRRNAIAILMGVELIINAAAINFVAFAHFTPSKGDQLDGQVMAVFVILIAAAEAVVALGIAIAVYKEFKHSKVDELVELQG